MATTIRNLSAIMDAYKRFTMERNLLVSQVWVKYLVLSIVAIFSLMDAIKQDAFSEALLKYLYPDGFVEKGIAETLMVYDYVLACVGTLIVIFVERRVPPHIWCVCNLLISILHWMYFNEPTLELHKLIILAILRSINVRYSMITYWFGPHYHSHIMLVQLFNSLLPQIGKLLLLRYYREVMFDHQNEVLIIANLLCILLIGVICYCNDRQILEEEHELEIRHPHLNSERLTVDKSGSWCCNVASVTFITGIHYDVHMFEAYANKRLKFSYTYDMVYVHIGLYVTVFLNNLVYNAFKRLYAKRLSGQSGDSARQAHAMNRARFLFTIVGYALALISRSAFLVLQLHPTRSLYMLVACVCLGGMAGNVHPILAEFMFRQRTIPSLRLDTQSNDSASTSKFWQKYREQIFKCLYMEGRSIIMIPLIVVWYIIRNYIGSWWFSANAISLLVISSFIFIFYYIRHAKYINV